MGRGRKSWPTRNIVHSARAWAKTRQSAKFHLNILKIVACRLNRGKKTNSGADKLKAKTKYNKIWVHLKFFQK